MAIGTTDTQRFWIVVGLVLGCAILYLLAPVIVPFTLGAILAYILTPLVDKMRRIGIPRTLSVAIISIVAVLILLIGLWVTIPLLQTQISVLISKVPNGINWLQDKLHIQVDPSFIKHRLMQELRNSSNLMHRLWATLLGSTRKLIEVTANLVIIPVVAIYLLRDWNQVVVKTTNLFPQGNRKKIVGMITDCGEVLAAFFRGQLLVMIGLGILYSIGLTIVGLDLSLLIGVGAGLLSVVPYLGFIVGFGVSIIDAFVKYHSWLGIFYVCIVFAIGHVAESYILQPLLVGNRIGLHPVAVIFSVLAGGVLFGFVGILLALPVAAVIKVLLMHLHRHYINTDYYTHLAGEE